MDGNPLLDFLLADLAWGKKPRVSRQLPDDNSPAVESADEAFAREIALAREVCEDQVAGDAATAFMPEVPLPFGGNTKSD